MVGTSMWLHRFSYHLGGRLRDVSATKPRASKAKPNDDFGACFVAARQVQPPAEEGRVAVP